MRRQYPKASELLIDLLAQLDELVVDSYRELDWVPVPGLVEEWSRRAQAQCHTSALLIEAEALVHQSQAYEQLGQSASAIDAIERLLRLRTGPATSGSRATLYERIVGLLIAEGRNAYALAYAIHGYRFSRKRDLVAAENLKRRIDQLRTDV